MAAYKIIGTGPRQDQGTVTHNGREYKPGDAFPAKDDTATAEIIAILLKAGQIAVPEPVAVAKSR